ncbi:MAG: DegV family protein [Clostridia bacterium]|nr:DegV family protein [Clostridia bacterium]
MDLIISMEATCDVSSQMRKDYDFRILDMEFTIDGEIYYSANDDVINTRLYERMKAGSKIATSQLNAAQYEEFFDGLLKEGKDVLHIGFSSGLSGTYYNALKGAQEANKKHKNHVTVIDCLGGCGGQLLLGIRAHRYAKVAKSIEDMVAYVERDIPKLNHTYTVDNLKYLVAGGRLKASSAFFGNMLKIKPIMNMNDEGKPKFITKVLTRKRALNYLIEDCIKRADKDEKIMFVSQAFCREDAEFVANQLEKRSHLKPILHNMGPIIGGHSGPGTLALFFLGDKR